MNITCENGHTFEKASNCRVCPTCSAKEHKDHEFLQYFSAPAQRALFQIGITSIESLRATHLNDLNKLHGIDRATMIKFKELLNQ
jgi:predicted RecB family nuclease